MDASIEIQCKVFGICYSGSFQKCHSCSFYCPCFHSKNIFSNKNYKSAPDNKADELVGPEDQRTDYIISRLYAFIREIRV